MFVFGEVLIMGVMMLTQYARTALHLSAIMVLSGVAYGIHSNNAFMLGDLMAADARDDRRGYYSSLINATLTAGQIVVGAFAG